MALIAVGFVAQAAFVHRSGGFLAFYGAPHGAAGAWAETSAYLYALSSFMFPAMCLLWGTWLREGRLDRLPRIAFLAALVYEAFEAFVFGNRGDTIRLFLLLLLPPLFLSGRVRLRRPAILLATTAALAAVLLFPQLREDLHLGAERSLTEAVRALLVEDPVGHPRAEVTGHELFYAAAVVEAASEQGAYHYGEAWLYPFLNLVPRAWWPDKPYGSEWSISRPQLVERHAGWTVAGGAATTGVADAYLGFSWFSVFVWTVFGWWGAAVWRRAVATGSVIDLAALWACLMMVVYFVTQGYGAAWHAWLFCLVPIRLLSVLIWALSARPGLERAALASGPAAPRGLRPPAP